MYLNTVLNLTNFNQPIKLIVGLGNVGEKYNKTRHNVGFLFVDYLLHIFLKKQDFEMEIEDRDMYKLYNFKFLNLKIVKPQLMMNRSGSSLHQYLKYQNYSLDEVLVVHDDLDINFGKYKLQYKKSPTQHNGVVSIENHLADNNFYRLRIGIENRSDRVIRGVDYVLMRFLEAEESQLETIFEEICLKEFSLVKPESEPLKDQDL